MIRSATRLAERGLSIFPLKAGQKVPACKHGCLQATTNITVIEAWWTRWPAANIGIACGTKSGIWVLDLDGGLGEQSLWDLERQCGSLPKTIEVLTGNGRHLYFRLPESAIVKNTAGVIGAGIDTRGDGGYVVAPPSIHPNGIRYRWATSATEFADAPDWLLTRLTKTPDPHQSQSDRARLIREGAREGTRNTSAAALAGALIRYGMTASETLDLLLGWNATRCAVPLPDEEVRRVVQSIVEREIARLRS